MSHNTSCSWAENSTGKNYNRCSQSKRPESSRVTSSDLFHHRTTDELHELYQSIKQSLWAFVKKFIYCCFRHSNCNCGYSALCLIVLFCISEVAGPPLADCLISYSATPSLWPVQGPGMFSQLRCVWRQWAMLRNFSLALLFGRGWAGSAPE